MLNLNKIYWLVLFDFERGEREMFEAKLWEAFLTDKRSFICCSLCDSLIQVDILTDTLLTPG